MMLYGDDYIIHYKYLQWVEDFIWFGEVYTIYRIELLITYIYILNVYIYMIYIKHVWYNKNITI